MANRLTKSLNVEIVSAGTPGTPGVPPTPAYCVTTSQTQTTNPIIYIPDDDGGFIQLPGPPTTTTTSTTTCYPATTGTPPTPGTPGIVASDFNLGWNGGARSIAELTGNGGGQFSVKSGTVGAVVGLQDGAVEFAFGHITHGFYCRGNLASVIESGAEQTGASPYVEADVFRIERSGSMVRYYKNGTLLHTSAAPSYGAQYLQAVLYSGGDAVFDPAVDAAITASLGAGDTALSPLAAFGGDFAHASASAAIGPLTTNATGIQEQGGAATLSALVGVGSQAVYAYGASSLPAITSYGDSSPAPSFTLGVAQVGPLLSSGLGTTSFISLHPAKSLGDASASWLEQSHAGNTVHIVGGVGAGQSRVIANNSAKALLFNPL